MPTSLKAAAWFSHISAFCMLLSGLAFLGALAAELSVTREYGGEAGINLSNQTQLVRLWEGRRVGHPGYLAADAAEIFGWLFILPAVNAAATVLGGSQRSATALFTGCFVLGATVNIVDFLQQMGTLSTVDQWSVFLTQSPPGTPNNTDDLHSVAWATPLQMLEFSYRMARSRLLWIAAIDHLFLCVAFTTAAYLACTATSRGAGDGLSPNWARFTGLCALLSFVGFLVGIARAIDFGAIIGTNIVRPVSGIYWLSVMSVVLPVWLIWTGCLLSASDGRDYGMYAVRVEGRDGRGSNFANTAVEQELSSRPGVA